MKKMVTRALLATTLMASPAILQLQASGDVKPMPSRVISASEEYMMEVESVDYKTGDMVLKGSDNKLTVHVDKDLHNVKKIHPGDWLVVTIYEEAVIAGSGEGEPSAAVAQEIVAGPKTGKPTLKAVEVTRLTAKVVDIDRKKRTMTLEGPTGERRTVHVEEDVQHFENLKKGDTVTATITKTILMKIREMD